MATNLEFIKSAKVTSSTATLNITDIFSAKYDVYKITIANTHCSGLSDNFSARLIDSGGSQIITNYDYAGQIMYSYSAFGQNKSTGQNRWQRINISGAVTRMGGLVMYVFNPFSSTYTFQISQSSNYDGSGLQGYKNIGVNKNATSCTGISFFDNGGLTIEQSNINVYGVK
jgi:hypothetical protein